MIMLFFLAQVATASSGVSDPRQAAPPPKISILVDPSPACAPPPEGSKDVVVCAPTNQQQRLPLRDDRGPSEGPVPVNPALSGNGALAAEGTPCAARQGGCPSYFGPPIVPIVAALVGAVKSGLAKHPDKTGRVAIPLDDAPPPPSKIEP
ncbi:MAG: hypothetical protein WC804_20005 [Sphingomonas sp.]|jgi:hypothetical protein|uniref:hypothetical protein n=1 Tax=Sphingomonas sp. TaxID=28214 RepID=UPI003568799E